MLSISLHHLHHPNSIIVIIWIWIISRVLTLSSTLCLCFPWIQPFLLPRYYSLYIRQKTRFMNIGQLKVALLKSNDISDSGSSLPQVHVKKLKPFSGARPRWKQRNYRSFFMSVLVKVGLFHSQWYNCNDGHDVSTYISPTTDRDAVYWP